MGPLGENMVLKSKFTYFMSYNYTVIINSTIIIAMLLKYEQKINKLC